MVSHEARRDVRTGPPRNALIRAARALRRRLERGGRRLIMDMLGGRRMLAAVRVRARSRRVVFASIYLSDYWKQGRRRGSASGVGSSLKSTVNARNAIATVVAEYDVRSILDAPCGDFGWMSELSLPGVSYTGIDIVGRVVRLNAHRFGNSDRRFLRMDIVCNVPPAHDLIICRDCLQHLSNESVLRILTNFSRSGSRLLLVTSTPVIERNCEIEAEGEFRAINLRLPPFSLGDPEREFVDAASDRWETQKTLLLYRLPFPLAPRNVPT